MPIQHRKPQPLALEYRFMFDGAAALDVAHEVVADDPLVDAATTEPSSAPTANPQPEPPALSVVPQSEKPAQDPLALPEVRVAGEALLSDEAYPIWEASIQALTEWLADFANEDDFAAIMTEVYELESLSDGQQRLQALQELLRTSGIPLSIELRESADLNHEMAAFARVSHLGDMRIYVNADWVNAGAGDTWIRQVLLEEVGHLLDEYLRPGLDTRGDEGELFMSRVLGWQTSDSARDQMRANQDFTIFVIEGMEVEVQLASLSFANAYEVYAGTLSEKSNESTTITAQPAEKEASRHNFGVLGLGTTRIDDLVISGATFSGNDVVVQLNLSNKLAADGNSVVSTPEVVYGWISRPIKAGGQVKGFYFWADANFQALGDATSDGNADADRLVSDNRGFILVVDQAYFDGLAAIATADSVTYKSVGSSSDRVDSALNSVLPTNASPTGVDDLADATPSVTQATDEGSAALEEGHSVTTIAASGNVLANDTDTNSDTLSVGAVTSDLTGASTTATSGGATLVGQYGTLTINSAGTWSYAVNNSNATVNALLAGSLQETFTYTVIDGKGGSSTATLTVQINGSNDAPTAVNDYNTAKESITSPVVNGYSATGNVLTNDADPDSGDTKTIAGVLRQGAATIGSVAVTDGDASMLFIGDTGFSSVGVGDELYVRVNGIYYAVYDSSGATQVSIKSKSTSGSNTTLTFTVDPGGYRTGAAGNQFVAFGTSYVDFFSSNPLVAFANSTAYTVTVGGNVKGATVSTSATTGFTTLSSLTSVSGTIAVGMSVSGTGVPSGTTVSEITYTNGVLTSIKLDRELTSTAGGAFTFSGTGTLGQTLQGAHGQLVLNSNGSYTYTPTADNPNLSSGQSAIEVFDYTMQDAAGVTSAAKLYITVYGTGSNDPVLVADAGTAYESGVGRDISDTTTPYGLTADDTAFSGVNATGNVITNDTVGTGGSVASYSKSDGSSVTTFGNALTGLYGSIVIADNGVYTYTLDNANATLNALLPGATLTETFIYKVTNTDGGAGFSQLVITIQGTNDQPVAVANTANVTEDSTLTATGNVLTNDTDADSGDTKTVINAGTSTANLAVSSGTTSTNGRSVTGTYGTLTIGADGTYVYSLNNSAANVQALTVGQTVTDVFTYEMRDTNGATSTTTLTVTVTGSNEVPINNFGGTAISATQPPAVTTAINTAFSFTGSSLVSVTDDGNLAAVVLEVTNGLLSFSANPSSVTLTNSSGGAFSTSGSYIKIEGTQAAINAALALLVYTPSSGFQGSDSLIINSVDSSGGRDIDGIAINIPTVTTTSVSEPALANGTNPSSTAETNTGSVSLAAGQTITAQQTGNFLNNSGGVIGTWQVNTNGTFSVTLTAGSANTSSSFSYVAYDEFGNAVNNIVSLTITDDTPLAVADTKSVNEGSTATGNVLTDGTPDKFGADGAKITNPVGGVIGFRAAGADTTTEVTSGIGTAISGTYGTLTLNAEGSYSYVATANSVTSTQTDVFVYTIEDADGDRSTATLTISVNDSTTDTIAVNAHGPVNEGSTYAMFTVVGSGNQQMSLSVTNGTATLSTPTIQYSTDGTTWTTYSWNGTTGDKPTGGTVYVRVAISSESDNIYEGSESFSLTATNITTPSITSSASASIIDDGTGTKYTGNFSTGTPTPDATTLDDDRPVLTINDATAEEGSNAVFTVSLSKASESTLQVAFTVTPGTAEAGDTTTAFVVTYNNGTSDITLTPTSGVYTIPAGVTTLTVKVPTVDDNVYEGDETFTLSAAVTETFVTDTDTGTGTIKDDGTASDGDDAGTTVDDDRPVLTINDATAEEGSNAVFTVSLSKASESTLQVAFTVTPGTAEAGDTTTAFVVTYNNGTSDITLTPTSGVYTIPAGVTTLTVKVPTVDDNVYEGDETFTLSAAVTETFVTDTDTGTGTIKDDGTASDGDDAGTTVDDDRPLSITNVTVNEASSYATFKITGLPNTALGSLAIGLDSDPATNDASITGQPIEVFDGTSWVAFTANVTTLDNSGELLVRVSIASEQDAPFEGPEVFVLSTSYETGNKSATGIGTLRDDGQGSVFLPTNDTDTPNAPADPGYPSALDNDAPLAVTSVTVNEASPYAVFEVTGGANQILASLSLGLDSDAATSDATIGGFTVEVFDGTAWVPFAANTTALNANGSLLVRVDIQTEQDSPYEGSEKFTLIAQSPGGAQYSGVGTIKDDGTGSVFLGNNNTGTPNNPGDTDDNGPDYPTQLDDDLSIAVSSVTVNEASSFAVFQITGVANQPLASLVVGVDSNNATANATIGYMTVQVFNAGTSSWVAFNPGVTTLDGSGQLLARVNITSEHDTPYEGSEVFTLTATYSVAAKSATGIGTIKDDGTGSVFLATNNAPTPNTASDPGFPAALDDDRPLTVSNVNVNENSPYAIFEISGGANQVLQSLTLGTDSNPATANADPTGFTLQVFNGSSWVPFSANATQLNNAGKLLVRVAIASESDLPYEGPEVFTLTTASSGGTPATGTGTIRDDGTGSIYLSSNNTVTPNSPTSQNYTGPQLDDDRVEAEADKDGIAPTVESYLATAARQGDTNAVPGDLNDDGIPDADQNAVTTLAWVDYDKFSLATTNVNTFLDPGDPVLQNQNLASIITLKVVESTSGAVIEDQAQLLNVSVIDPTAAYTTLGPATLSTAIIVGKPTDAVWDPFQFSIESVQVGGSLVDVDPSRAGTQVRTLIDISRAQVAEGDMIGYMKYVTQAALDGYNAQGVQLRSLDNVVISTAGWYDFTQRTPGGDGARFITSNGIITAIELTITDNAFGDNDQRTDKIYDPGVPIFRSDDTPSPLKPPPALPPEPPPIWRNPLLLPPSAPYNRGPSIPYLFDSTLRPTQSSLPQYELSRPEPDPELLEDGFYQSTSELARYYDLYTDQDDWRASVIPAEISDLRVFRGMPDQFVEHAAQGSFTVPWDAFVHTKREAEVRLTATLADDTDLPAWIQLNGQTGIFKVDPPPGISGEWIIKLIARDNEGREASTLFRMHVAESSDPSNTEPRVTPELSPAVPSDRVTPPADAPRRKEEPMIQTMALAEVED